MENSPQSIPSHFKGKDAIAHVVEAQASGIIASSEIHGTETSGKISAGTDALRDCSLMLLLVWQLFTFLKMDLHTQFYLLAILGCSLLVWKAGRSAWLGWSRLERLHRILAQEKWEIEHNRQQERDELRELYAAKGFEGKLLEDVLDVLMADSDRLLRVMVQEELGLSLETYEHPLMQSLGAGIGALFATGAILLGIALSPALGALAATVACIGIGAALAAYHANNGIIPAIIWNLGLLSLAYGSLYFLIDYFFRL
ncbi:MAG: VIT1/CCC1 transporter family protein [Parachlamydiaceae bacterium]